MPPKKRYAGLRNCQPTSVQEGESSARTRNRVPLPPRVPMPNQPSSLEDDIPEFEADIPEFEDGIPEFEDGIPEFEDVPFPNEPGISQGSSSKKPKTNPKWIVDVIDEEGNRSKKSLKVRDLIPNNLGFKVLTQWNARPQPVGLSAGLLGGFLGFLGIHFEKFPILYKDWHEVPDDYKNNVYNQDIKKKFVVNDGGHKKWILGNLGKKWRDNRCKLFNNNYNWELSKEENCRNPPEGIPADHWRMFLEYRLKPETLAMADQNAENRSKQKVPHTLGAKTLARLQHELEVKNGRPFDRADMYEASHTKSNGDFVSDEARQNCEKLQQALSQGSSVNQAFVDVFGKEHPGHCRSLGLGVTPSQLSKENSHSTTESYSLDATEKMSQMQNEIDTLKAQAAEVEDLKAKAAEVDVLKEQVAELPLLKEQIAYLMQIHKQNQAVNLESQDNLRRSSGSSQTGQNEVMRSRRTSR